MSRMYIHITLLSLLASNIGCIVVVKDVEFVRIEEARNNVSFQNTKAWDVFYDSLRRIEGKQEESSFWGIPFIIFASNEKDYSHNAIFNDESKIADIDGDGIISEEESNMYAKSLRNRLDDK